jgi:hypothetical protein
MVVQSEEECSFDWVTLLFGLDSRIENLDASRMNCLNYQIDVGTIWSREFGHHIVGVTRKVMSLRKFTTQIRGS